MVRPRPSVFSCWILGFLALPLEAQWSLPDLAPPSAVVDADPPTFGAAFTQLRTAGAEWLFVASPGALNPVGDEPMGAVHVWRRAGDTWVFEDSLFPSTGQAGDGFGITLAGQGDVLAVGTDPVATQDVYLFEFDGSDWIEAQTIIPPVASAGQFGHELAVYGELLLLADSQIPGESAPTATHVEIYRRDESTATWELEGEFGPFSSEDVISGLDVRTNGATADAVVAVVEPGEPQSFVQLFHRNVLDVWFETQTIDGQGLVDFATDVRLQEQGRLVVAHPGATVDDEAEAGALLIYQPAELDPNRSNWELSQTVVDPLGPTADARFGESFALTTERLVVGSAAPELSVYDWIGGFNGSWFYDEDIASEGTQRTDYAAFDKEVVVGADGDVERFYFPTFDMTAPTPALRADPLVLASDIGGTQSLLIDAGPEFAGASYWILGSASGTSPSFSAFGFEIPLRVPDDQEIMDYFFYTIGVAPLGTLPLVDVIGSLDADGRARPSFRLPPESDPLFDGIVIHHVALLFDPLPPLNVVGVTDAAPLELRVSLPPVVTELTVSPGSVVSDDATPVDVTLRVVATPGVAEITSYKWIFGDATSTETTAAPEITHPYGLGVFQGTCTVIDAFGLEAVVPFEFTHSARPTAVPSIDPSSGPPGTTVTLSGAASSDPDGGDVVGFCWVPGAPSCTTSPTLGYTIPGDAEVGSSVSFGLVVFDDEGTASGLPVEVTFDVVE